MSDTINQVGEEETPDEEALDEETPDTTGEIIVPRHNLTEEEAREMGTAEFQAMTVIPAGTNTPMTWKQFHAQRSAELAEQERINAKIDEEMRQETTGSRN